MDEKIVKLLEELKQECIAKKIPMFAMVADELEDGTHYESRIVTPLYVNKTISNDRISSMSAILSNEFRIEFSDEILPGQVDETFFDEMEEEF